MPGRLPLRVFISYTGPGKDVWLPLERYLRDMYYCEIVWGLEEYAHYGDVEEMMRAMVRKSDVALFLLTEQSTGILRELQMWYEQHGNKFANALLLKAPSIDYASIYGAIGARPPCGHLDAQRPWESMAEILPKIHRLFCTAPYGAGTWRSCVNQIVQEAYPLTADRKIPLQSILEFFEEICGKPSYGDPQMWTFRFNWPREPSGIDGYSDETNCVELFAALLQPRSSAMGHEVEAVFAAVRRVLGTSDLPPSKLSGRLVFVGASSQTLREVQLALGNHAYENRFGPHDKDEELTEPLVGAPCGLLLPREVLAFGDNYERLVQAQVVIPRIASQVCKYVLCSTFQVSISYGMMLTDPDDGRSFPAMACTAAGTDKEQLAAFADAPVLVRRRDGPVFWYGQLHRPPTTEHRSHWCYHERALQQRVARNLIVHFHPIELLDLFRTAAPLCEPIIKEVRAAFTTEEIDVAVDEDYLQRSARSASFGEFMLDVAKRREESKTLVVWKPNHGVWLLTSASRDVVGDLLKIQRAAHRGAKIALPKR